MTAADTHKPVLERLHRMFVAMAAAGWMLLLTGILGVLVLAPSLKGVAAASIGVGLFCVYVGIHSHRKYGKIVQTLAHAAADALPSDAAKDPDGP